MRTGDAPAPGKIRFFNTFSPIFIVWRNGNRGNTVEKRLWFKFKDDLPKRSLIFSQTCKEWAPRTWTKKGQIRKIKVNDPLKTAV